MLGGLSISAPVFCRRSEGESLRSRAWLSSRSAWRTQSSRDTVVGVRARALRRSATRPGVFSRRSVCTLEPSTAFCTVGHRLIAAMRRRAIHPGGLQFPARFKCRITFPADGRPSTVCSTRGELARVALAVEAFDQTVHPSKAQCLVERILVIDRSHAGVQTLYASILWRGAQEDAASFLASDWPWQSERSKNGNHLHLLSCCVGVISECSRMSKGSLTVAGPAERYSP